MSDHIDLLDRYDDGIVGVSFISSCVMRFRNPDHGQPHHTNSYLPARSIVALVGDARYKWTHGIPSRRSDLVKDESELKSLIPSGRIHIVIYFSIMD